MFVALVGGGRDFLPEQVWIKEEDVKVEIDDDADVLCGRVAEIEVHISHPSDDGVASASASEECKSSEHLQELGTASSTSAELRGAKSSWCAVEHSNNVGNETVRHQDRRSTAGRGKPNVTVTSQQNVKKIFSLVYGSNNSRTLGGRESGSADGIKNRLDIFSCKVCGKLFPRERQLIAHCTTHTGKRRPFQCEICRKSFINKSVLAAHAKRSHYYRRRGKPLQEREKIRRGTKHSEVRNFACNVCGKSFTRKNNLVIHNRIHTGERPFMCNVCGKTFVRRENLMVHSRIHTGEHSFTCKLCGMSFAYKGGLVAHSSVHTGESPFTCTTCGKSFTRKVNLVAHSRTHTKDGPLTCKMCEKHFIHKKSLVAHIRILHTELHHFVCKICGKTYTRRENLGIHNRSHTGEHLFVCEMCGKSFNRKYSLTLHIRSHR